MQSIIYDDEHLQVIHRPGPTAYALVTFTEFGFHADGENYWAKRLCDRRDIACFGVAAKRANWFPSISMRRVADVLHSGEQTEMIGYGHSMGGYACLKYASLLRLTGFIASCPQFSINPDLITHQPQYTSQFRAELHSGMEVEARDVSGHAVIIHDPFFFDDQVHIKLLRQACPDRFQELNVRFTKHGNPSVLRNWSLMAALIASARTGRDVQSVERLFRSTKKTDSRYRLSLAEHLVKRKGWDGFAERLLETVQTDHEAAMQMVKYNLLRVIYGRTDRREQAVNMATLAADSDALNPHLKAVLGSALLAAGRPLDAERVFRDALGLNTRVPAFYHGLADSLIRQGSAQCALEILAVAKEAGVINAELQRIWDVAQRRLNAA